MYRFPGCLALLLAVPATASYAVELKPDTLAAWEHYLAAVDDSVTRASSENAAFLQPNKEPKRVKDVQAGKVVVWQAKPESTLAVPHGLIHDWVGVLFIPHHTLADVFAVTRDYEKYPKWYGPTIDQAHLLERHGNDDRFTIRYVRRVLFISVVLETEYETRYFQVNPMRWYSIARSIRIQEIDDSTKGGGRKSAPDSGNGYLWRIYTLTRYEEKDNGLYVEQESIGLSKPIPSSLHWLIEPVLRKLSRDLLGKSLEQTRGAVVANSAK